MKIQNLNIKNFRNYKKYSLSFSEDINIFIGSNAVGKTNLIEAIYFLSLSKSFKTNTNSQVINFDEEFSIIEGIVYTSNRVRNITVAINNEIKKCKIDNVTISKLSEFIGILNVVLFIPDDLLFVKGSPKNRRDFLNTELSKISPIYVYYINKYNKLLKEKNSYLKSNKTIDFILLDVLDEQISKIEVEIITKRINFILKLNNKVKNIYSNFVVDSEIIDLKYSCFCKNNISFENIYSEHLKNRNKDIKYKQSIIGIHKDDIEIFLNNNLASNYSSQGQQRSIILSIKIALLEVIFEEVGEYPILLLDDVLSELDDYRKSMLLNLINKNVQTFITTTSIDGIEHEIINKSNKIYINRQESREI